MMMDYLSFIAQGIPTSLGLMATSLVIAFVIAVFFTFLLSMENKIVKGFVNGYLMLFTGTPLLVQFFLIYSGPGQFQWLIDSPLWILFSDAWFCAVLALALNSAAYSTQLFHGAVKAIPKGQWETCAALGLSRLDTLKILIPYALKRALPSYSNEIILVFKGTSLASTITILDIMGYARQLYGTEYDAIGIYSMAGLIYL
ncbi:arginine ABC transporter permease ArtM, partial [Actinobacillus minor]